MIIKQLIEQIQSELNQAILGKERFVEYLLAGFLSKGHVLIEDVPGLGKTTIAKALSKVIKNATSARIQCTPDLLPYDVTGMEFYDVKEGLFRFDKGPVFADILLADELNRANPRTQSALLEAMAEGQVTISNTTYSLSSLFFVIATQNPVDGETTYSLPIAELDRFLFKLTMGYPSLESEIELISAVGRKDYLSNLNGFTSIQEIEYIREYIAANIRCSKALIELTANIAKQAREHSDIILGPSPRATIQLIQAAKALAAIRGREFITDEDIKELLPIAWVHRMKSNSNSEQMTEILLELYYKAWSGMMHREEI